MRAIHELRNGALKNYRGKKNLKFRDYTQKPQNHSTDKQKTKIIFHTNSWREKTCNFLKYHHWGYLENATPIHPGDSMEKEL